MLPAPIMPMFMVVLRETVGMAAQAAGTGVLSSCCSHRYAMPLPAMCMSTSDQLRGVLGRAPSRAAIRTATASQVITFGAGRDHALDATSCASTDTPPDASVTTVTSQPSPSAWIAGMATQISVHSAGDDQLLAAGRLDHVHHLAGLPRC